MIYASSVLSFQVVRGLYLPGLEEPNVLPRFMSGLVPDVKESRLR